MQLLRRIAFFLLSFACLHLADAKTPAVAFISYYSKFCHQTVPESPETSKPVNSATGEDRTLYFDIAYFTGGSQIFPGKSSLDSDGITLSFHPKRRTMFVTENPDVIKLQATLKFHLPPRGYSMWQGNRNLREIHFRGPRIPVRTKSVGFEFFGFWSRKNGELCMVGSGSSLGSSHAAASFAPSSSVVLRLKYPVSDPGNVSSLILGSLESVSPGGSLDYFEPVSILAVPHFSEYKYSLMSGGKGNCLRRSDGGMEANLPLELKDQSVCLSQLYQHARSFELEYGSECSDISNSSKCNPLTADSQGLPGFMTIQGIRCEPNRGIRVLVGFHKSIEYWSRAFGYGRVFNPNSMLLGEGAWDEKENKLCVIACRVLGFNRSLHNASVGDCSIQLNLRFPKKMTIQHRSNVVGQISSSKSVSDAGYFPPIGFHGTKNKVRGLPGLKYDYTMLDLVGKSCVEKKIKKGKGTYPSPYSYDMRFDMSVTNSKGQKAEGDASPFFVGEQFYEPYRMHSGTNSRLNLSYRITFTPSSDFELGDQVLSNRSVDFSAEGTYNKENGMLCMIGCRHLVSHIKHPTRNETTDCKILITMQFASLNSKARADIKGSIESTRGKEDPLYFAKLQISSHSIYIKQAADSIWRMDIEILLVLVTNTLSCIFVGLQLYHVSKHPDALPFLSFVMLLVLTLGHMIPLLLNFEAMFGAASSRQNVFLGSGGWLEVNEIVVRMVTMVAFLLQFRLLQLTWSSRQTAESRKNLWLCERRVVYLSLPLYVAGGLIAWYAHHWKNSYNRPYLQTRHRFYQPQHYPWDDFKSYAGLILDGFLLPQIVFNLFLNSSEHALSLSFYMGTTIVRLLPHAYDLYRAHSSSWYLDLSYIYANHRQDFYSTSWNIIIPIGGLLFAAIIYSQQRFGGRCILPKRFRASSGYEKVPTINSEEMTTYSQQ
ncbi:unnamed protein product [Linum tenue]|uniref:RING-type E3 ubiquitin transferase n=3 Tax=Linum tenue TaxID=586396 RepID=A0AAV0M579_9ROSI|nr:unnamed protein product [Linum tenue]